MSIKGSRNRDTNKPAWDAAPIWNNWKTKAKNQRIFEENKDKIAGSNVADIIVELLTDVHERIAETKTVEGKGE